MLEIVYDPDLGFAYKDGETSKLVNFWINQVNAGKHIHIITSTFLTIQELRLAIQQGRLPLSKFMLLYRLPNGGMQQMDVDTDGNIARWPEGFGDHLEKILIRLL